MKSALAQIGTRIDQLIVSHAKDLEEAWANSGDNMKISFSADIGFESGHGKCDVGISFTTGKVKDSVSFEWSDKQLSLLQKVE